MQKIYEKRRKRKWLKVAALLSCRESRDSLAMMLPDPVRHIDARPRAVKPPDGQKMAEFRAF
jgi:hypothetical protein